MAKVNAFEGRLVVLVGGSGFFGSRIAQELLQQGARLRIAGRHAERAFRLKPLGNLGQVQFAPCDVTKPASLAAAMQGADAAVYLVGAFAGPVEALQVPAQPRERYSPRSRVPTGSEYAPGEASAKVLVVLEIADRMTGARANHRAMRPARRAA